MHYYLCTAQVIINNVIGHLPDASRAISSVGLARMFSSLTGYMFCSGMLSGLGTTVPQAIGARRDDLLRFYVQRAFTVVFIMMIPVIVLQFFADKIFAAMGQPPDILYDVKVYCVLIIPNIYGKAWLYIVTRVIQGLNYNYILTWSTLFCAVLMYPLNILFVEKLNFGFLGSAFALDFASLISFVIIVIYLWWKGYGVIFKPMFCSKRDLLKLLDGPSLRDYFALSLPGLVQSTFEFWIEQIGIILSGYIVNPTLAISVTVIMALMNGICIMFCWGCYMAITIRVGKYVGAGMEMEAKRSAKAGVVISTAISSVTAIVLIVFRKWIPYFFTNDESMVDLLSDLILVLSALQFFMILYYDLTALYRGIGEQKVSAKIVLATYYGITLPITLCLLFIPQIGLLHSTLWGSIGIWSSLALGNLVAALSLFLYLIWRIDWKKVMDAATQRIGRTSMLMADKTKDNYGSVSVNE